jgi:hypothetical protein
MDFDSPNLNKEGIAARFGARIEGRVSLSSIVSRDR